MSRSYNEDWERKKSYLIRSLFHDIPYTVLSPVPECTENTLEEGTKSSDTQTPQETTTSQEFSSESSGTTSDTSPEPVPPSSGVYPTLIYRPYSPLPPLIIERMPNKHDDPPEYYQMLLAKIRLIYRKMFIEGRDLSEDDFFISDNEKESIMNEVFEMAASLSELSEVDRSLSSDGYSADTEMSDNEESNDVGLNSESIRIENSTDRAKSASYESASKLNSVEERNNTSNNANDLHDNNSGLNSVVLAKDSFVSDEEADYQQVTTQADVHIDGTRPADVQPSPVYEEPQADLTPSPEELLRKTTSISIPQDPCSGVNTDLKGIQKCEEATEVSQTHINEEMSPKSSPGLLIDRSADVLQVPIDTDALFNVPTCSEVVVTSPILPFTRKPKTIVVCASEERSEMLENEDANLRQTVTEVVHEDITLEAAANEENQEPVFVLRFRSTADHSLVAARDAVEPENDQERTTTEESQNFSNNRIEVARTPLPEASLNSNPINMTRLSSDMDLTCERVNVPQDISTVTSASQDGCHVNTAEPKYSYDIQDVLTSILNESSQNNEERMNKNCNSRKRTYEEMSAQTDNIFWNDLRANFFVGTPKIFKLCSCVDHVCF